MPRNTSHRAESSAPLRASSVRRRGPLSRSPDFVSLDGPPSQIWLAAFIQHTFMNERNKLPAPIRDQIKPSQIKFTGFVGINLLWRHCDEAPPMQRLRLQTRQAAENLGIPSDISVREIAVCRAKADAVHWQTNVFVIALGSPCVSTCHRHRLHMCTSRQGQAMLYGSSSGSKIGQALAKPSSGAWTEKWKLSRKHRQKGRNSATIPP